MICEQLMSLPYISIWNTSNITNMRSFFNDWSELTCVPDRGGWNTSNVIGISELFSDCSNFQSIPVILK